MTFSSPVERADPPHVAGERAAMTAWLDYHRATLVGKLHGLGDEALRRPMVPSGLCLLGLVKHLTAVEHAWFAVTFAQSGEAHLFFTEDDLDADFRIEDGETTESVITRYLDVCERSRRIEDGAASLDETVLHPRRGELDLRWIMVHMIEETARHNGHADIIRELIDGTTGD